MVIKQYGIELVRLEEPYLEMLRQWRNAPEVARNMEFRQYITPEMQKRWFDSINNLSNFYFLIRKDNTWFGLIHLSAIDYSLGETESGLFVGNPAFLNTPYPVLASLVTLDFAFKYLSMNRVFAKVNKKNDKALTYNRGIGFRYSGEAENSNFVRLSIEPDSYFLHSQRWHNFAMKKYEEETEITFDEKKCIDKEIEQLIKCML